MSIKFQKTLACGTLNRIFRLNLVAEVNMDKFTHCVKCGAEKTLALECPACGAIYAKAEAFYKPPPPKVQPCPACGGALSVNASACPHCGEPNIEPVPPDTTNEPQQNVRLVGRIRWQVMFIVFAMVCLLASIAVNDYINNHPVKDISGSKKHISQAGYGANWPYSIPEGRLNCENAVVYGYQKRYVTVEYKGVVYAINGHAIGSGHYAPLETIRLDDPKHPGSKMPDPGIINLGLKLCN
jgi:hypothetical protein